MKNYLQTFADHLATQSKRSLPYLKRGLSSSYGTVEFMDHLGTLGYEAVRRSNFQGHNSDSPVKRINEVGKVIYFHRECVLSKIAFAIISIITVISLLPLLSFLCP